MDIFIYLESRLLIIITPDSIGLEKNYEIQYKFSVKLCN